MPAVRPPRLAVETLEDRVVPTVVPTWELTEGNASAWKTFASDSATASVRDDASRVAEGAKSLTFTTASGFDTGIRLAVDHDAWDVSGFRQLTFWTYGVNTTSLGFQGNQPVVELHSAGGYYRYTPSSLDLANNRWVKHHVPLEGSTHWTRETVGTPNLSAVTSLEIHQDTWDAGFEVTYDGMRFDSRAVTDLPPAGPAAPASVVPGRVSPKVLLYVFDPIMENHGGQRLHQVYGWGDPVSLTAQSLGDLASASHGMYTPQVVQTVIADLHPYFADGFQHTDASFDTAWAARDFHGTVRFDYARFIAQNNLAARVDSGEIDEVWIYAPPICGAFESVMAGGGAYFLNGDTQPGGRRAFPIMGLNYERGVGEAIHSFGHRAENTIAHIYEPLSGDANNSWAHFTRLDKDAHGQGGVGNVHFPVNGQSDYDYDNATAVSSDADAWLNYPNLSAPRRTIHSTEWTPTHADAQREYLDWWYAHMPHVAGRGPDGQLNNWWRYLGDLDAFKTTPFLEGSSGAGTVRVTGVSQGTAVTGVRRIVADSLIDGVLGRVDLYIDGTYRGSDTLAPFTFDWNTNGLSPGNHTLQLRGYEVQAGTETRSAVVTVQAASGNRAPVLVVSAASLPTIAEDPASLPGVLVIAIATTWRVTDADTGALRGIALTSASATGGRWQYSLNNGRNWRNVGTLSVSSALLLAADAETRVRFLPDADYNGDATVGYRAWDRTSGANGSSANTSANGGSTPFSVTVGALRQLITPVNDAPRISPTTRAVTMLRNTSAGFTGTQAVSIADVDAGIAVLRVTLSVVGATNGTLTLASNGGLTQVWGNSSPSLTINGTLAEINAALRRIVFRPMVNFVGAVDLQILADDRGSAGSGGIRTALDTIRFTVV